MNQTQRFMLENDSFHLFAVFFCCGLNMAKKWDQSQTTCPDSCLLQKELYSMKDKIEIMETMLKDSENRLINSESQIVELKNQASKKVIFSAAVGQPGAFGPFKNYTTLVYTTVITNIGSAYSPTTEFGAMREKLGAVETKLKESENQILDLKNKEKNKVVFSVATGGLGHIGPVGTDTTIIYKTVITNIGNAYSQFTGIFAAPVAGIYYFTFFYHAGGDSVVSLALIKNNQAAVAAYDHRTLQDGADNGGNAVFLQLQQGDQVYMRLAANTHVWGNDQVTTFSGFLVSQV